MKVSVDGGVESRDSKRLRGGFYTPSNVSDFVTSFVVSGLGIDSALLEPSCGDGEFIRSLSRVSGDSSPGLVCLELNEVEHGKSSSLFSELNIEGEVLNGDFLGWSLDYVSRGGEPFAGVLGNPPYIKYQSLSKEFQVYAREIVEGSGLKFVGHMNAWVPFLISSLGLLKPGGRMGFVVPSELLHVTYASGLRDFLIDACRKVVILDPNELLFEGTIQGVVILLAEKKLSLSDESEGVSVRCVDKSDIDSCRAEDLFSGSDCVTGSLVNSKWTSALLTPWEQSRYVRSAGLPGVVEMSEVSETCVGLVTGANEYFIGSEDYWKERGLLGYTRGVMGGLKSFSGIVYGEEEHKKCEREGYPTRLLCLDREDEDGFPEEVLSYVRYGVEAGYSKRYKCRIRTRWFEVPSRDVGSLLVPRMSHLGAKVILNRAQVLSTDRCTKLRPRAGFDADTLAYCFMNPLTAISCELNGRYYGGGVLELVPGDLNRVLLPVGNGLKIEISKLNEELISGGYKHALKENGVRVLGALGMSRDEVLDLYEIWLRLVGHRTRV